MRSSLAGTKMSAAWWRWVLPEMPSGPCRRPCQPTRRRWSWVLHGPVTAFLHPGTGLKHSLWWRAVLGGADTLKLYLCIKVCG